MKIIKIVQSSKGGPLLYLQKMMKNANSNMTAVVVSYWNALVCRAAHGGAPYGVMLGDDVDNVVTEQCSRPYIPLSLRITSVV